MMVTRRRTLLLMGALACPVRAAAGSSGIAANVFVLAGAPFRLDGNQSGEQRAPRLAATSSGGFMALLQQEANSTIIAYGRYYTSAAAPLGAPLQIGGTGVGTGWPVAFTDGSGLFIYDGPSANPSNLVDIFAQRMGANRKPAGTPVILNQQVARKQLGPIAKRLAAPAMCR